MEHLMKSVWIKSGAVVLALIIGYGSMLLTKTKDGPIEQAAEAVLRAQGIDVDLSPEN
jgi:hypothetical protein